MLNQFPLGSYLKIKGDSVYAKGQFAKVIGEIGIVRIVSYSWNKKDVNSCIRGVYLRDKCSSYAPFETIFEMEERWELCTPEEAGIKEE